MTTINKLVDMICNCVNMHDGLGVWFLLDGLDEYQPENNI